MKIKRSIAIALDIEPTTSNTKNCSLGRYKLGKRVVVALTHIGCTMSDELLDVTWDLFLLNVNVLEVFDRIEMILPFLVGNIKILNQGWKYARPHKLVY